jgi:hypothetical protein
MMMFWGLFLTVAAASVWPREGGIGQRFSAGVSNLFGLFLMFAVVAVIFGSWAGAVSLCIGIFSLSVSMAAALTSGDEDIPIE